MAAMQEDTLNQQGQRQDIAAIVEQAGGGGQTVNNVSQTQVNTSAIPDRDLTTSMYAPQLAM
jgi:hypothetical protein